MTTETSADTLGPGDVNRQEKLTNISFMTGVGCLIEVHYLNSGSTFSFFFGHQNHHHCPEYEIRVANLLSRVGSLHHSRVAVLLSPFFMFLCDPR